MIYSNYYGGKKKKNQKSCVVKNGVPGLFFLNEHIVIVRMRNKSSTNPYSVFVQQYVSTRSVHFRFRLDVYYMCVQVDGSH